MFTVDQKYDKRKLVVFMLKNKRKDYVECFPNDEGVLI